MGIDKHAYSCGTLHRLGTIPIQRTACVPCARLSQPGTMPIQVDTFFLTKVLIMGHVCVAGVQNDPQD